MRYFFDGKLVKQEDGYSMRIPFNVWEVVKQRDSIEGELIIDNEILECVLLPEEKGNYTIHLTDEEVAHIDTTRTHKVLLYISGTLIQMNENSPYDFEHPVREINDMEILIQPGDGLCGQSCVAMLAGVPLEEVMKVMDCREWQATMGRVISALNYYGIDHSHILVYTEGKQVALPKCCIMMERMGRYCHYLIHYDGKFYDPNLGILPEYDMSKLLGYLKVRAN